MLDGDAHGWFIQVAYASEGRGGSVFTVDPPNVPTAVLEELASRIRKELDDRRRLVMIVREQTEREARERRP